MTQIHVLISSEHFYDFNCVPGGKSSTAPDGYQYISPNLTFPCDGVVTKWKIGTENQNDDQVYLQIWRPVGTNYSRVDEIVYNHSGEAIAEVPTDVTVSAGDVIGFFIPRNKGGNNVGLKLAWAPVPDHTLLQGVRSSVGVSPEATFTGSPTTLSSSPLVSVIFGKCTMIVCIIRCVLLSCALRVNIKFNIGSCAMKCSLVLYVVQCLYHPIMQSVRLASLLLNRYTY